MGLTKSSLTLTAKSVSVTNSFKYHKKNKELENMNQFSLLDDIQDAKTQRILDEQRKHQALLLLQQQKDLDQTFPELAAPVARSQFNNHILQRGFNPIDIECRNIIALQEELKRQESRRRAEEVIQAKMQEQALLVELQKQAVMQQSATEQMLNQFVELDNQFGKLDNLVARQEAIRALGGQIPTDFLNNIGIRDLRTSSSNNSTNQDELLRSILAQEHNIPGLQGLRQLNGQFRMQSPLLANSNIVSSVQALERSTQAEIFGDSLSLGRQSNFNDEGLRFPNGTFDRNITESRQLLSMNAGVHLNRPNLVRKDPETPSIRFFNNGNEVNQNGEALQGPGRRKKRKIADENQCTVKDVSFPDHKKKRQNASPDHGKVNVKKEMRHAMPPKKNGLKLRKYLSSKASKESVSKLETLEAPNPHFGPQSDHIPPKIKQEKRQVTQKTNNIKEEDKLDAANVLLGLMKNS